MIEFKDYRPLLRKRLAGKQTGGATRRLCWPMVRDIRRFAQREGFGLSLRNQITVLHRSYPVGASTLEGIVRNQSWFDPAYAPGQPDIVWWSTFPLAYLVLFRNCSLYDSRRRPSKTAGVRLADRRRSRCGGRGASHVSEAPEVAARPV